MPRGIFDPVDWAIVAGTGGIGVLAIILFVWKGSITSGRYSRQERHCVDFSQRRTKNENGIRMFTTFGKCELAA